MNYTTLKISQFWECEKNQVWRIHDRYILDEISKKINQSFNELSLWAMQLK